jgi:hypothetical protein
MTTASSIDPAQLDQLAINTVHFLSVDAIEKADSGHPGLPPRGSPMAYVLCMRSTLEYRRDDSFDHGIGPGAWRQRKEKRS